MKTKIISIFTSGLLLLSCNNNSKTEEKAEGMKSEKHIHSENNKIELNKGEKWKIKENMLVHLRIMETEVNLFSTSEKKDYESLAKKLQESIGLLTSSCTMTGKAHDELHKWLLPYIELVTEFSKSKDKVSQEKHVENIRTSFIIFNQFFN